MDTTTLEGKKLEMENSAKGLATAGRWVVFELPLQ
jgi:hypothetical protein